MQVELILLRQGARRGHLSARRGSHGFPACTSNPPAIYTAWAPSWLSRRGAVRLMDVSNEKNKYLFGSGASSRRAGDAPRRSRLRAVHIFIEWCSRFKTPILTSDSSLFGK